MNVETQRATVIGAGFAIIATVFGLLTGCHTEEHAAEQKRQREERARTEKQVYGPDKTIAPAPSGAAAPKPGDPVSPGAAVARITVKCEWRGRRWFGVTVMRNQNPRIGDPRQVRYTEFGKSSDPSTGGGEHIDTLNVAPGETVSISCVPHPDRVVGDVGCFILHHRAIVVRNQQLSGSVTCTYTVPAG